MSGKKLFVGNLPWSFTDQDLESLFQDHGPVVSAKVITDRQTGRSRGFGFVELESAEAAQEAIRGLDGRDIDGRAVRISEAEEKAPRRPRY